MAAGKLASQREQFCFGMYTCQQHLENLSYQTHAKCWALKSSCVGTFSTKQLSETIVAYGVLRVKTVINPTLCKQKLTLKAERKRNQNRYLLHNKTIRPVNTKDELGICDTLQIVESTT